MMKQYPLKIENAGEDTYELMSRGHHDIHEFMRQVRADGYEWSMGVPVRRWMKAVPTCKDGCSCWYHEVKQSARGAFPVTWASEAYGEDRYEEVFPYNTETVKGEQDNGTQNQT